ncbi:MAG: hypothetical protein N2515_06130 [Deltaproteobacteria bacterium]|nr:hypothetical protein [Deltaproteobacteria bacterium]
MAFGELAGGIRPSAIPRDEYGYPGVRLRHLYLEWRSPIGLFRLGQMGFRWGMGLVANDGEVRPPFGDYRFGDLVRRLLFATRPMGADSPWTIALAFDWVAWDLLADFERPCPNRNARCRDLAFQGLFASLIEFDRTQLALFFAARHQRNHLDDELNVAVFDAFVQTELREPSGGTIELRAEGMAAIGRTTMTRSVELPARSVEQFLGAIEVARRSTLLEVFWELGFASGDSNPEDGVERRATIDPDHRIGLVLFPEVLAWQSARSAWLAQNADLVGRPARGAELLPTNGGVSGAIYLFPRLFIHPLPSVDFRLGAVVAWAAADLVDPYRLRVFGQVANHRGGDPRRRDLGVELDGAINGVFEITSFNRLELGVEGGIFFPGRAFDDENGKPMAEIALVRVRAGLIF